MFKIFIVALLATGLIGGIGFYAFKEDAVETPRFRTLVLEREAIVRKIDATGTLEPEELVDVAAQVAGTIVRFGDDPDDATRKIDYGSLVHTGDILAQVDDTQLKARVDSAVASRKVAQLELDHATLQVDQANQEWQRAKRLETTNSRVAFEQAKMKYDQAVSTKKIREAALTQADAAFREAEVSWKHATITSPIDGVIIDRRAQIGQTVGTTGNSLFLVAKDLSGLEIWASVNEADVGNISKGQRVRFKVTAYPDEEFEAVVHSVRLNAQVTGNIVTYTVVVKFDNQEERLLPYMTADMVFEVERRDDVLQVPNAALRWRPERHEVAEDVDLALYATTTTTGESTGDGQESSDAPATGAARQVVWLPDKDGQHVRPLSVTTGISDGFRTEVQGEGLQAGMTIVLGRRQLQEEYNNLLVPQVRGRD